MPGYWQSRNVSKINGSDDVIKSSVRIDAPVPDSFQRQISKTVIF